MERLDYKRTEVEELYREALGFVLLVERYKAGRNWLYLMELLVWGEMMNR
jgi:hypothetical protein